MKHIITETSFENEQLAKTFVLAAFEKKMLTEQLDVFYESVDDLSANLDIQSRQKLFENAGEYMKKQVARLNSIEQQLAEMLPDFVAWSETVDLAHPSAADEPVQDNASPSEYTKTEASPVSGSRTSTQTGMPRALTLPRLTPDKPTLIAMEPAPMVDEDDDGYQFEEDEEFDLRNEDSEFSAPLPQLPATEMDQAQSPLETNFEQTANATAAVLSDQPDVPIVIQEERVHGAANPQDITEPVRISSLRYGMDEGKLDSASPVIATSNENWKARPETKPFAKETMRFGDTDGLRPHGTEAETQVARIQLKQIRSDSVDAPPVTLTSPSHEDEFAPSVAEDEPLSPPASIPLDAIDSPADLAALLEPETESDPIPEAAMTPDTEKKWDEDEPPTDSVEHSLELTADISEMRTEDHILFWRQNRMATEAELDQPDNRETAELREVSTSPDGDRPFDRRFALSRIPSLLPTDAIRAGSSYAVMNELEENEFDDNDMELAHIEPYSDETDDATDDVTEANLPEQDYDASEEFGINSLEEELYRMIDAQPVAAEPAESIRVAPPGAKRTLVGLGQSTIERVNALAIQDGDDDASEDGRDY